MPSSVDLGSQLEKFVGGVIVTYCLQSPAPCVTKSPVPFLLELINGHVVPPHAVDV